MKRTLLILLFGCFFGAAQAQTDGPYVGGGLWLALPYNNLGSSGFSVQGGVPLVDGLEARVSGDIWWLFTVQGLVSAEALYTLPLGGDLDIYLGAGPSLTYEGPFITASPVRYTLDLAATAGLEYSLGGVGLFADFKIPVVNSVQFRSLYGLLRTGVNVYF